MGHHTTTKNRFGTRLLCFSCGRRGPSPILPIQRVADMFRSAVSDAVPNTAPILVDFGKVGVQEAKRSQVTKGWWETIGGFPSFHLRSGTCPFCKNRWFRSMLQPPNQSPPRFIAKKRRPKRRPSSLGVKALRSFSSGLGLGVVHQWRQAHQRGNQEEALRQHLTAWLGLA